MDAMIQAAPVAAEAVLVAAVVTVVVNVIRKVTSLVKRVAVFVRLSIGGVSLSAIAPDYILEGGTA